jgi:hypothetical protein
MLSGIWTSDQRNAVPAIGFPHPRASSAEHRSVCPRSCAPTTWSTSAVPSVATSSACLNPITPTNRRKRSVHRVSLSSVEMTVVRREEVQSGRELGWTSVSHSKHRNNFMHPFLARPFLIRPTSQANSSLMTRGLAQTRDWAGGRLATRGKASTRSTSGIGRASSREESIRLLTVANGVVREPQDSLLLYAYSHTRGP